MLDPGDPDQSNECGSATPCLEHAVRLDAISQLVQEDIRLVKEDECACDPAGRLHVRSHVDLSHHFTTCQVQEVDCMYARWILLLPGLAIKNPPKKLTQKNPKKPT
jgi:hypothetical protein